MALINNIDYSWSMIELSFAGGGSGLPATILTNVSGIKWNTKRNVKTNYGLGGNPVGRGVGNIEYTASITLNANAIQQLCALTATETGSVKGTLMGLGEFDLIISWVDSMGIGMSVTHTTTLQGCFFNEDGMDVTQDDTNITKEFDLNPFKIINNV